MVEHLNQNLINDFKYVQLRRWIEMPDDLVSTFKSAVQADTEKLARQVPAIVLIG
jgi:hypothetical protein